ncbi:unnamed protein product [Urochloa humidicola]
MSAITDASAAPSRARERKTLLCPTLSPSHFADLRSKGYRAGAARRRVGELRWRLEGLPGVLRHLGRPLASRRGSLCGAPPRGGTRRPRPGGEVWATLLHPAGPWRDLEEEATQLGQPYVGIGDPERTLEASSSAMKQLATGDNESIQMLPLIDRRTHMKVLPWRPRRNNTLSMEKINTSVQLRQNQSRLGWRWCLLSSSDGNIFSRLELLSMLGCLLLLMSMSPLATLVIPPRPLSSRESC